MPDFRKAEVSLPAANTPYPGERERHRSRQTAVMVIILDTEIERPWLSNEGGRWATLCEDHGYYDNYGSLAQARQWYAYPAEWCPVCSDTLQGINLDKRGERVPPG